MFIIGYLDQVHQNRIRIPEFHTGHLGFLPGTKVYSLGPTNDICRTGEKDSTTSAELIITPFNANNALYRITCTFIEDRGVVRRFVSTLAALRINILSLESASIDRAQHHVISATVDLSSNSALSDRLGPVPEDKLIQFRHLLWCLHADDYIAFDLALRLVKSCSDILSWSNKREHGSTIPMPDISIAPLIGATEIADLASGGRRELTIERSHLTEASTRKSTFVTLPHDMIQKLRDDVGESHQKPLHYIMVSETNSRSLRIKFISSHRVRNLFQIGFRTADQIGALHAITDALEQARFNILVSLTRKISQADSVWEAVLEYQGSRDEPQERDILPKDLTEQLEFVKSRLEDKLVQWPVNSRRAKIRIFTPSHIPNLWGHCDTQNVNRVNRLSVEDAVSVKLKEKTSDNTIERLSSSAHTRTANILRRHSEPRWIINYTANFPERDRVFISHPSSASNLKNILQNKLERAGEKGQGPEWAVETYTGNAGISETVERTVRHKILSSDLFVGIWFPEKDSPEEVSPWLPYELGVARAYEKPCFLIVSAVLPSRVFRTYPGVERLVFTDAYEFSSLVEEKLIPNLWKNRSFRS